MPLSTHPLWLVGFRPFFALACLSGVILPVLWAMIFSGWIDGPDPGFGSTQWHAHEMLFGFGWAVLGGFLLTSTKNWVNIRGYHGPVLMLLAAAWIIERLGMSFGQHWPDALRLTSHYLFLGCISALLVWTLIRHRHRDSYRDNIFFIVMLPAFLAAKAMLLDGDHFIAGYTMTIALFRLAFLVMLERTLSQFMKAAFQVAIPRRPALDMSIKLMALVLVLEFALPRPVSATLSFLLACLLLYRVTFWKPFLAIRRIDIGIMFIGYLALTAQLVVEALGHFLSLTWVGSFSVHLFTFGVMGTIIPAMLMRIAKGHTGRRVVFDGLDRSALHIMLGTLMLRVALPQISPSHYLLWIQLSAAGWMFCFGLLAWRYIPFLLQPRIDGKEH